MNKACVIVPNWNGLDSLAACLDSLLAQTAKPHLIVVDNASSDGSVAFLRKEYPTVEVLVNSQNEGFAGGVNTGIRKALDDGFAGIALFNNDAVADKNWLRHLLDELNSDDNVGIATGKLLSANGEHLDSTGEFYTTWGLPYPRGRDEKGLNHYDEQTVVFAASGGASLYRSKLFEAIGLFDEDFFAYYEDVDLSFRAQLAGWTIHYVPAARAYHDTGSTSRRIKGFTAQQTFKNLPMLLLKNVPSRYLWHVTWRYLLAQFLMFGRAVSRGQGLEATKGKLRCVYLFPQNVAKRRAIQATKTVSDEYIWNLFVHDLPPQATALRQLRARWWKLIGRET